MFTRVSTAAALSVLVSGCAHAYAPYGAYGPDILPDLPLNAPPGECYARVQLPSAAPPVLQGAQWVMAPGPPGAPGPIWCLVPTGPAPVAWDPPRYGFIRVLCEDDLTFDRVRGIQSSLYQRGFYQGGVTGRYDAMTAAAVQQFQSSAQIAHGGYLSFDTVQALNVGGGYFGAGFSTPAYGLQGHGMQGYGTQGFGLGFAGASAYASAGSLGFGGGYPTAISPCVQPCAPVLPPPCAPCLPPPPPPPPPCIQYYSCGFTTQGFSQGFSQGFGGVAYHSTPGVWGAPAYASAHARAGGFGGAYASARAGSAVQGGWLTWPSKGWGY